MPKNIEIKARCTNSKQIHQILKEQQAQFVGIDRQIDTYFNVSNGRLKLREGNIENHLIFYRRSNQSGPKKSEVHLYGSQSNSTLKKVLTESLGTKIIVDKKRAIYFIDNVKFHIDEVQELGSFIEIEAIDRTDEMSIKKLHEQCLFYMNMLQVQETDLVEGSYSDLLIQLHSK